jgi:uncharacterized protein YrrD
MLHCLNDLLGFRVVGSESVGVVTDLLFDGHSSLVRYLRAESEDWLPGGDLLLAPEAIEHVDPDAQVLRTSLRREVLETRPPVARPDAPEPSEEATLHGHFRWTPYWTTAMARGLAPYWGAAGADPSAPTTEEEGEEEPTSSSTGPRRPLRSAWSTLGFAIAGPDGEVGAVEDLILDLDGWVIRYLVASTGVWLPGAQVLISPQWLSRIDWAERSVVVDLPRARLEASPTYDRGTVLDRGLEEALHRSVGKPTYW